MLNSWKEQAEETARSEVEENNNRSTANSVRDPDHRADWIHLHELTATGRSQIRDSIGGRVRLQRGQDLDNLKKALDQASGVVLLGPSGIGKSATVKILSEQFDGRSLWFDARSFERIDFAAFQADLKVSHPLSELFRKVSDAAALVVIDGLDRLYDRNDFTLVASFVKLMNLDCEDSSWRLMLTCQTQEWNRLRNSLSLAGVSTNQWRIVECEPLTIESLSPVWEAIPQASRLPYQSSLLPLLTNLKVLDLIASRLADGKDVPTDGWIGESSVAGWFWEAQVATDKESRARERLAMLIAERQADQLRHAVALDAFNVSELGPLGGLERDRVCRTEDGKVLFFHDLLGDWSRLRILLSRSDDVVEFLRERINYPLWHRALRLYGVHLLDLGKISEWRDLLTTLSNEYSEGTGDLLLDSIIFAADPLPLLTRACSDLTHDDGRLLRRLLRRFLLFTTLPDPGYVEYARSQGVGNTTLAKIAAQYRYPNWPYWLPLISFIYEHKDELVPLAAAEIARLAELWLGYAPERSLFRREVAELGLMLGERARRARDVFGTIDNEHCKLYYRVALAGARELPDAVAAFALRACERLPEECRELPEPDDFNQEVLRPAWAHARNADLDYLLDSVPITARCDPRFDPDEQIPEPWADGPLAQVDSPFREAVLERGTLKSLAHTRPAVAREVVLASLIKERRLYEWNDEDSESQELNLHGHRIWFPALYTHGPFFEFLKIDFGEGLRTIIDLVDFASERWCFYKKMEAERHGAKREDEGPGLSPLELSSSQWYQPPGTLTLSLGREERNLIGDARTYDWSAGGGAIPRTIVVALMALEKFLYSEMDEGRPLETKVREVLEQGRSVALLKVLCDIGKRDPALFKGPLRPLLTVPEIFAWEIHANIQGRQHLMIGTDMRGEVFDKVAQDFHSMEHRSKDLLQVALDLVINDSDMRKFFEGAVAKWKQRSQETSDDQLRYFIENLIVALDVNNHQLLEHPDYGSSFVNVRALESYGDQAKWRLEHERELSLMFLPIRCRQIIDEGIILDDAELESIWEQVQQIDMRAPGHSLPAGEMMQGVAGDHSLDRNTFDGNQENAIAGAVAMFICQHRSWLNEHSSRIQWCRDQLRELVLQSDGLMDVPVGIADWTWDCFAAEALATLWAEDPSNSEIRDLVANLVFIHHHAMTRKLFARCADVRHMLGDDFDRLRHLLFEFAYINSRIAFVQQSVRTLVEDDVQQFFENVEKWVGDSISAFVHAELASPKECWQDMDRPNLFKAIDNERKESFCNTDLDFDIICAGHEWIPPLNKALSNKERHVWLEFWRTSLVFVLSRAGDRTKMRREPITPGGMDRWVLTRVAAALPFMTSDERPEDFWKPILDFSLGDADVWSELFFHSFYEAGLRQEPVHAGFARLRADIIDYVFGNSEGQPSPRWSCYGEVWLALLGIDGWTIDCWQSRHQPLIEASRSALERWVIQNSGYGRHLGVFASWLMKEAAASIRLSGLDWLGRAFSGDDANSIYDREASYDRLASLLHFVWHEDELRLRRNASAFRSFQSLLQMLVDNQNVLALDLVKTIGRL